MNGSAHFSQTHYSSACIIREIFPGYNYQGCTHPVTSLSELAANPFFVKLTLYRANKLHTCISHYHGNHHYHQPSDLQAPLEHGYHGNEYTLLIGNVLTLSFLAAVVPSAKKRPLCPSMFTTPLGLEKRPIQGHLMTSGEKFTPYREGGGAAPAQLKPFDLQMFHSHQVTGGGALVDSNTRNNRDLFADK